MYAQIQKAVGATERVFELLEETPEEINADVKTTSIEKIKGNVAFKNVAFSYPSRKEVQVLKDVNFNAEFGQKLQSSVQVGLENLLFHLCYCVFTTLLLEKS